MPHHHHVALLRLPVVVQLRRPNHGRVVCALDLVDEPVHALDDLRGRLAAGAAVPPDVPRAQALFFSLLADLGGGDAFVVAVVPLADVFGHGDASVGPLGFVRIPRGLPGEWVVAADVKELERLLGTATRADVAADRSVWQPRHRPGEHWHVGKLPGHDQSVIPDEGPSRGAHALLAVGSQEDVA